MDAAVEAVAAIASLQGRGLNSHTRMDMPEQPWYQDGLRFAVHGVRRLLHRCSRVTCGSISRRLRISPPPLGYADVADFERLFVRQVGVRRSLKERSNFDCVLLDPHTRKCRAYAVRPTTMSLVAVLGLQRRQPRGLGANLPGLPGKRPGHALPAGRDRSPTPS